MNDERAKFVLALLIGFLVGFYIRGNGAVNATMVNKQEPANSVETADDIVGVKYQYDIVYVFFNVDDSNVAQENVIHDISELMHRSNVAYTNIEKTEKGYYRVDLQALTYNNESDYQTAQETYHNRIGANLDEMLLEQSWSGGAVSFILEGQIHYLRP